MALEMKLIEGRLCPVVICDVCGEQIRAAKDGACFYSPDIESRVLFAHFKGCLSRAEQKDDVVWMNLESLLAYLSSNLELPLEKLIEHDKVLDSIGL